MERQWREEEEEARAEAEEEEGKRRAVREFEKVIMDLEGGAQTKTMEKVGRSEEETTKENRGMKRKFELDEEEILQNAKEERATARRALDDALEYLQILAPLSRARICAQHCRNTEFDCPNRMPFFL
jgi:hypothetical protein